MFVRKDRRASDKLLSENLKQRDLSHESVVGLRMTLKLFWNRRATVSFFILLLEERSNVFLRSFIFTNIGDVLSKVVASVHPNSYVFYPMLNEWPMIALYSSYRKRTERFRKGFPPTAALQLRFCSTLALCCCCSSAVCEMQINPLSTKLCLI